MTLLVAIGLGLLGIAAVVLIGSDAGDAVGAVLVIGALATITRSVIRRAGEAGTRTEAGARTEPGTRTEPVRRGSASSPEATSRSR
jgi:hypothetical protein